MNDQISDANQPKHQEPCPLMKPAEEWAKHFFRNRSEAYQQTFIEAFREIQQDAIRSVGPTAIAPSAPDSELEKAIDAIEHELIEINQDEWARTFIADIRLVLTAAKQSRELRDQVKELSDLISLAVETWQVEFKGDNIHAMFSNAKQERSGLQQQSRTDKLLIEKLVENFQLIYDHSPIGSTAYHTSNESIQYATSQGYGTKKDDRTTGKDDV